MNKDNILKIKDLQGNEKEVNANDPKYIIAELEAIKSLIYKNEAVKKLIANLQNNVFLYDQEATKGIFVSMLEVFELERKEAELVTAYCNLLYEKMQYRHMQNGVILFLDEINKQSDQEFKEFIEGITEARENYKNDIERYCNK